jgi:ABC-2 type transport system permease protein
MSGLAAQFTAAAAVCKRDLILFSTYRMRFITTFVTSAVSLTLFYYISRLVNSSRIGSPDDYYAFVVVGLVVLGVLTSVLSTPVLTLRQELVAGTFERMVLSPFGAVRCIVSLMIFPVLLATVLGIFTVGFAALVFDLSLRWDTAALGIPVVAMGAAAFAPFGLLMAAGVMLFKQTSAGATFVITGLAVVAGVYFPVALLPDWVQWVSEVQPFTPVVDLTRNLLVGTPLRSSALLDVIKLVAFPAVMLPLAAAALQAAARRSRRLGTIMEY